jgi:hypothetical protein
MQAKKLNHAYVIYIYHLVDIYENIRFPASSFTAHILLLGLGQKVMNERRNARLRSRTGMDINLTLNLNVRETEKYIKQMQFKADKTEKISLVFLWET